MSLNGLKIGFGVTGSHCTLKRVFTVAQILCEEEGACLFPVFSPAVADTDTRFGKAAYWRNEMERITGEKVITSIVEAEPVGPRHLFDMMVIAPASGNTIAKLVNGVTDTAVLMAAKAQLRNGGPLVVAISTNDGLGASGKNIGILANTQNIYMVPFGQDDPMHKPHSLVAKMELLPKTIQFAQKGKQIQPVLIEYSAEV